MVNLNRPRRFEKALLWYARCFPIQRGKLRLVNLLWRLASRAGDRDRIAELIYGGLRMPCDISEMLQRQFYFFGTYFLERRNLQCWGTQVLNSNVVFDIGANAGIYSLAAKALKPGATVHAFEPTREIASRLRETVLLNGLDRISVHELAVSDQDGVAMLGRWAGEFGDNAGMNYLLPDKPKGAGERVLTVRLDTFCRKYDIHAIDLLKLDIQGHEYEALLGAEDLIESGRIRVLFIELNWLNTDDKHCPARRTVALLNRHGYVFSRPTLELNFRRAGNWLEGLTDVVAAYPGYPGAGP